MQEQQKTSKNIVTQYFNDDGELVKKSDSFKAITLYKGKIALVQNEYTQEWTIPGGRAQKGENIEQALQREFREETNLKGVSLIVNNEIYRNRILFRSPVDNGWREQTKIWFFCELRVVSFSIFKDSLAERRIFFTSNEAYQMVKYDFEKEAITCFVEQIRQ